MRTDRELLELAAKAFGRWGDKSKYIENVYDYDSPHRGSAAIQWDEYCYDTWSPLTDDGDALRLAIKLRISIIHEEESIGGIVIETIEANGPRRDDFSRHCEMLSLNEEGDDPMKNTRRAIVLAAAEIGASIP